MGTREAVEAAFAKLDGGGDGAEAPETPAAAGDVAEPAVAGEAGADSGASAGWEKAVPPAASAEAAESPRSDATEHGRDGKGRFKGRQVKPEPKAKAAPATESPPAEAPTDVAEAAAEPPKPAETKAPQSWKPAAREAWAKVPPEVQAEVARVDREVRQVMQESAGAKKLASDFQAVVGPFEAMIRAEGGQPLQAVGNLLTMAAAMRTAPTPHRVAILTNLVRSYGVPADQLAVGLVVFGLSSIALRRS